MLADTLAQINEALLVQICTEQWPETPTLDFKAMLPASADDGAKEEFRKDVCALANASGGDLVFGISERSGSAASIVPILEPFEPTKRRLQQILGARVEPVIHGVNFHHCALAGGGHVMVVRVPESFEGPHRCGPPNQQRFVYRNDTITNDMTYDQLRNAFGRKAALTEMASGFRADRIAKLRSGFTPRMLEPGPVMAVHIVPIGGMVSPWMVDIASLHKDYSCLRLQPDHHWLRSTNFDGLAMYPHNSDEGVPLCSQIFRNGSFEVLARVGIESRSNAGDTRLAISGLEVANWLRDAVSAYARAAPRIGATGSVLVSLALAHCEGTLLITSNSAITTQPIAQDVLVLPEMWVEDISAVQLDQIARPIMEVVYQSYAVAACPLFDANGLWKE